MYGYIYITTNTVNGKQYIGQHVAERFEPDVYVGSGVLLFKAIQKYSKHSFVCKLLCECDSQEELDLQERYWIDKYDAVNSSMFYNLSEGGVSGSKESLSARTKELWKDARYRKSHVAGALAKWSDEPHRSAHIESIRAADHVSAWSDEKRAAHQIKQKLIWSDPKLLQAHSQKAKELWKDSEKIEAQRRRNKGTNNPCYGRRYHTDGCGNWKYVRPEDAPEGWYTAEYIFIYKDNNKVRHEKSKPIPSGWSKSS